MRRPGLYIFSHFDAIQWKESVCKFQDHVTWGTFSARQLEDSPLRQFSIYWRVGAYRL